MTTATRILAADVGRTSCRVLIDGLGTTTTASGSSLSDPDGVARVLAALDTATGTGVEVNAVAVGVTGAAQARAAARALAHGLAERHPGARVLVTSDVVTAHAGALAGRPGVVLIAGTGAVALGIDEAGRHHLVDGHGPRLGDAGSGAWIGHRALDAALRHHDGRPGGSAALAHAAEDRFGPLDVVVGRLQSSATAWRDIAAFTADVVAAADVGDASARRILSEAVAHLTDTARAAAAAVAGAQISGTPVPVSLVGGIVGLTHVRDPLVAALDGDGVVEGRAGTGPQIRVVAPVGDALEGARALALQGPGIHHDMVLDVKAHDARTTATPTRAVRS